MNGWRKSFSFPNLVGRGEKVKVAIVSLTGFSYYTLMRQLLNAQLTAGTPDLYSPTFLTLDPEVSDIGEDIKKAVQTRGYDLVITIGRIASVAGKKALEEINGPPLLFVGARDPLGLGLVKDLQKPGVNVTGVIRQPAPTLAVAKHIAKLAPEVRDVVVPYLADSSGNLPADILEITQWLTSKGMRIKTVPIQETYDSIANFLQNETGKAQCIVFLEGCYSNLLQDEASYLLWKRCQLFFGSGPTAIQAGAACSFGSDINEIAITACRMLSDYVERGISFHFMPVAVLPDDREFLVNVDMLKRIDFPAEAIERICSCADTEVKREWPSNTRR